MSLSATTARNEIQQMFWAVWNTTTVSTLVGYAPTVTFPNVPADEPDPEKYWARYSLAHDLGHQATLGQSGGRRFSKGGLVTVQLFAPLSKGGGLGPILALAQIVQGAYEGQHSDSGVWFQDVVIKEIGTSDSWYQVNVQSRFRYEELH